MLDRILDTPHIGHVVPRLQPELLHRMIQTYGLEDCGQLLALATPEQLSRIIDLDLWRPARPGRDEHFDADRFGVWLQVLLESGASTAAQKVAGMDVDLVIAGLAQHAKVVDRATVTPYETTDGQEVAPVRDPNDGLTADVGGYRLVARGPEAADSWDAIVTVLMALAEEHHDCFHQVMRGCRTFSNSTPEVDGLHDLLTHQEQALFDLAFDREGRREKQGFATPPQARAFLQMARQIPLGPDTMPSVNQVARAYFRALDEVTPPEAAVTPSGLLAPADAPPAQEDPTAAAAVAHVLEILREADIVGHQPRALLDEAHGPASRLSRIQAHMQRLLDSDYAAYSRRNAELAYLANTLLAGCSIQARAFSAQEASDAAVAVCNLGLENWPAHWLSSTTPGDSAVLASQDFVTAFQLGWTVLHDEVSMHAAGRLIEVLKDLTCDDETQAGLDALRVEMTKHCRAGEPWRAREAMDVIAILDLPAWATLLALIDECPVIHAGLGAVRSSQAIDASAFEFISTNSQIASVREYLQLLPETLRP